MNLTNLKSLSLLFISIFPCTVKANNDGKVLYGSSAYALPPNVHESVYSGFLLALKNNLSREDISKYITQDQRNGASALEASDIIQSHLNENLEAVFGFPSTHESQLVSSVIKEKKILTVFASSTNSNIKDLSDNIYSTSEDPRITNNQFAQLIKEKYNNKKGLIIYYQENFFSLDQKSVWQNIKNLNPSIDIEFYPITKRSLNSELIDKAKTKDYLIITSFPTVAFDLLTYLIQNKVDKPIFTNSSWYKVSHQMLSRVLSQVKSPVYMVDVWNRNTTRSKEFTKLYKDTYHQEANIEAAIGYEEGLVLAEVIKRKLVNPTKSYLELFKANSCFKKSPLGDICFTNNGGFAKRELKLIKLESGVNYEIKKFN